MAAWNYKSLAVSTLDAGINDVVTSFDLQTGEGANFPSSGDFWIHVHASGVYGEIMKCTARSTDTLTVTRGQDGTAAASHSGGDLVELVVSAAALDQLRSDICQRAAFGSRPSASKDGILFLPSDGFSAYRDNGSTWNPHGPIYPFTAPPTAANWTWENQGTATVADADDSIILTVAAAGGTNLRCLIRSVSGNFDVQMAALWVQHTSGTTRTGIVIYDSASGKLISFGSSNDTSRSIDLWTSVTSFSSGSNGFQQNRSGSAPMLLYRVVYTSGSGYVFYVSANWGQTWVQVGTANTSHIATPTDVGIFIDSEGNSIATEMTLVHWTGA